MKVIYLRKICANINHHTSQIILAHRENIEANHLQAYNEDTRKVGLHKFLLYAVEYAPVDAGRGGVFFDRSQVVRRGAGDKPQVVRRRTLGLDLGDLWHVRYGGADGELQREEDPLEADEDPEASEVIEVVRDRHGEDDHGAVSDHGRADDHVQHVLPGADVLHAVGPRAPRQRGHAPRVRLHLRQQRELQQKKHAKVSVARRMKVEQGRRSYPGDEGGGRQRGHEESHVAEEDHDLHVVVDEPPEVVRAHHALLLRGRQLHALARLLQLLLLRLLVRHLDM